MRERPYTDFYARMLGGFSLDFRGTRVQLDVGMQTISMQLLLMLLKAGNKGLERKEILQVIREKNKDPAIRARNLHQQNNLLRKIIARYNIPPGKYAVWENNSYYFSRIYQVVLDTDYLDEILEKLRRMPEGTDRTALLRGYIHEYTGEFLPMLCGEEWVTIKSAYYHNAYIQCINEYCNSLKAKGDYEQILEICTTASQIHPYDEWQAMQIECLIAENRYKEAIRLYEETAKLFYGDWKTNLLERVMMGYRNENGLPYYIAGALSGIKDTLREKEGNKGAYYLSYPAFLDLYRIMNRLQDRLKIASLLMMCTLCKGEETQLEKRSDTGSGRKMEMLGQVLSGELRKEDAYTRYSENQFLILLTGAKGKDEGGIIKRLENKWKIKSAEDGDECGGERWSLLVSAMEV